MAYNLAARGDAEAGFFSFLASFLDGRSRRQGVDIDLATSRDLLKVLASSIKAHDGAQVGRPASIETQHRARHVAELEAIREFQASQSIESAVLVGIAAFDQEMHQFRPI